MTSLLILLLPILGQACNLERYVDYPQHDLANMPINVRSEGDCAEQCYGNIRCDYWTFRPRDKKCWLKDGRNQRVYNRQDLVSGDKACGSDCSESDVERNIDYPENDIEDRDGVTVNDQDACEERCTNNENCKYWSYSPKHKHCWLKSDKGGRFSVYSHPDRVSGKRKCPAGCFQENRIDYPEGDIRGSDIRMNIRTEDDCSELCLNEAACNFWSYSPNQDQCWLKHTKGVNGFIHGDSDRISGNKACGSKDYVRAGNGKLCEESINQGVITEQRICEAAAAEFGLTFGNAWDGPGDHPGCLFADDRRQRVYFNQSPIPADEATSNYESLCAIV